MHQKVSIPLSLAARKTAYKAMTLP